MVRSKSAIASTRSRCNAVLASFLLVAGAIGSGAWAQDSHKRGGGGGGGNPNIHTIELITNASVTLATANVSLCTDSGCSSVYVCPTLTAGPGAANVSATCGAPSFKAAYYHYNVTVNSSSCSATILFGQAVSCSDSTSAGLVDVSAF